MPYYVYILRSELTNKYYCGQTDNIVFRLNRHNGKEVKSTMHGVPWQMIGYVLCSSRSEAMILERTIKKRGIQRWLMDNEEKIQSL